MACEEKGESALEVSHKHKEGGKGALLSFLIVVVAVTSLMTGERKGHLNTPL